MATTVAPTTLGAAVTRVEGREKVTGEAAYAYEHEIEGAVYAWIVQATIASGAVRRVDAARALRLPGVLGVLWHENAPDLGEVEDGELAVLQSRRVAYRGQIVALTIADSLEVARDAAALLDVAYEAEPHDVELRDDHPKLYKPPKVNPNFETDTEEGDVDAALARADVVVDRTYTTPAEHNNPLEPHATLAVWRDGGLTLYDSTQGAPRARDTIAAVFDLPPERVRVISPHVGGGFGSKGTPRPTAIAAALAAKHVDRPVKLAATRQQMFAFVGYRTPTIQRLRLGADAGGRLLALAHEVAEQTSTVREFAEQTAVPSRMMYASQTRRTSHRVAALDVPTPSWMRAPGETPGMYALESAMDELAIELGLDPIELRARNEPETDPETGLPFSSRGLVACLREGAARFGWERRDPTPGARRNGPWLVGTGVASSTYPARRAPSAAFARALPDGTFVIGIGAADIGTGARTVLLQIAADALEVPPERVRVEIGDSALPFAMLAGGSMGTTSWGSAIVRAIEALRERLAEHAGDLPPEGVQAQADTTEEIKAQERYARHAFGAQFCEVRVNADTGEVRVARMLGVFACGRILNPLTSRSQFIGGMTQGVSMALHEESVLDLEFGDYLNHDLAQYHVPVFADIGDIEATWIEEEDPHLNPMGAKGIGEIGIVGTAAAVANAVHHATGVRVRDLPIRLDRVLAGLAA
ncbi:MAG TPA: xanthine dehydrogenase family protein molybdopterin-binding subunit [Solirubrobacteraceae bacterium]|nr:xanthine dehydrogenase family protein molybdopterin-binding subunit [Solirubrobacteraceae bacterium]